MARFIELQSSLNGEYVYINVDCIESVTDSQSGTVITPIGCDTEEGFYIVDQSVGDVMKMIRS